MKRRQLIKYLRLAQVHIGINWELECESVELQVSSVWASSNII